MQKPACSRGEHTSQGSFATLRMTNPDKCERAELSKCARAELRERIRSAVYCPFGTDKYPLTVFFPTLFTTISNSAGVLPL